MAYMTCQHTGWNQLAGISSQTSVFPFTRGWDVYRRGAETGIAVPPLQCPSALAWPRSNAAISNNVGTFDATMFNTEALSPEALQAVAAFVDRHNTFESIPSSPPTPVSPPAVHISGGCFADRSSMVYAAGPGVGSPP